jgi:hypothetical protein
MIPGKADKYIKKLSKSQLMQLFYSAKPPSFFEMNGEYKAETIPVGILSPAADFFTHKFFGPGRWIGKAFSPIKENLEKGYNHRNGIYAGRRRVHKSCTICFVWQTDTLDRAG